MHPVLFEILGVNVGTYALLAFAALAAGSALASHLAAVRGHDRIGFLELVLWSFVVALLGAKVLDLAVSFGSAGGVPDVLRRMLRTAGHWHGGLAAGAIFLVIAFRRRGIPMLEGFDALAPAVALGHGIGRVGCFLAGCCFGKGTSGPFGVTFTSEHAHSFAGVPLGVPLHPVQLYEAALEGALAAALAVLHGRAAARHGLVLWTYLAVSGLVRLVLEAFRADPRGEWFGETPARALSALAFAIGLVGILRTFRRSAAPPPA